MILASSPSIESVEWTIRIIHFINFIISNPDRFVVILLVPALLAGRYAARFRLRAGYRWALAAVSVAGILMYADVAVNYCLAPQFDDHIEPQIAAVSYLLLHGIQIYQPPSAAVQYSMVYGPFTYIWFAAFYWLIGPSIFAAKIAGVASALAGVALLFAALKRSTNWWIAIPCTGLAATVYIGCARQTYWARADSHEIFLATVAVFALTLGNPWMAAALVGISAGICINMKFTAAACFLPIATAFILRYRNRGAAALAVVLSIVVAAAPFFLPAISLVNYLAWLGEVSHHPLDVDDLRATLEFAGRLVGILLILGFPSIWSKGSADAPATRQWYWTAAALGAAIVVTLPFAAKAGAGAHHLMPMAPIVIWLIARSWSIGNSTQPKEAPRLAMRHVLILPVLIVSMIFSSAAGYVSIHSIRLNDAANQDLIADLQQIQDNASGHTVEMGVGNDKSYTLTYMRPVLVYLGNPYHLDPAAAMDSAEAQHGLPAATAGLCRSGLSDFVLIPKGDVPFSFISWYPELAPVFSSQFVRAFHENYRYRYSTVFFDVYGRNSISGALSSDNR